MADPITGALMTKAAEKGAEEVAKRVANTDTSFVKTLLGRFSIYLGDAFQRYLHNSEERYNMIRTIATEPELRPMIGPGGIYVQVRVSYAAHRRVQFITVDTAESLLEVGNQLLIEGSGGMGKSMLMRYLLLNTMHRGSHIPVLLELRKISRQFPGQVSIQDLIYDCMEELDVKLPRERFEDSLRMGKYLFLMDGFDEVKSDMAVRTAEAIQTFSFKFPKNMYIVTSRPGAEIDSFENFARVTTLPFRKNQAIDLAGKISKTWPDGDDKERAAEFCQQLDEALYKQYKSFAENPLLLSMMFLTFMNNASISNHLADFYRDAYDVLYRRHDAKKGNYHREFKCKLDETQFRQVFSHFCFQTYMNQKYEFTKEELFDDLKKSINKFGIDTKPGDYFWDLRYNMCMLMQDGKLFRFSHRSFQTFFAAFYTVGLEDDIQKKLLASILRKKGFSTDYFELLFQIESERAAINSLEDVLDSLTKSVDIYENPDIAFFRSVYRPVFYLSKRFSEEDIVTGYWISVRPDYFFSRILYLFNSFEILDLKLWQPEISLYFLEDSIPYYFFKVHTYYRTYRNNAYHFSEIDTSQNLNDLERRDLYLTFAKKARIPELRAAIYQWIQNLNKKRTILKEDDFYKDL